MTRYKPRLQKTHVQFQPFNHPSSPNRPSLLKIKNHNLPIDKRQYRTVIDDVLHDADIKNKIGKVRQGYKALVDELNSR